MEGAARDKVNLIAKSVGTMVAMLLLPQIAVKVNKIILCGVPSVSSERRKLFQDALKDFPIKNIICFQNRQDPICSYREVKVFLRQVNPQIRVVEMPRHDHHYPYFAEFQKFLFA